MSTTHTTDETAIASAAARAAGSDFDREDVDAAVRVDGLGAGDRAGGADHVGYVSHIDPRGLTVSTETAARLVTEFGDRVLSWKVFRDEVTVVVAASALLDVMTWLRDSAGWGLLSDISPCDWLGSEHEHPKRFAVNYHVTKIADGAPRLRVQVWLDEDEPVASVMGIYPTADWHEREAYDFFGIVFEGRAGLRRLIMADDWVGHPLRKDYPIGGEPVKFTNSLREI